MRRGVSLGPGSRGSRLGDRGPRREEPAAGASDPGGHRAPRPAAGFREGLGAPIVARPVCRHGGSNARQRTERAASWYDVREPDAPSDLDPPKRGFRRGLPIRGTGCSCPGHQHDCDSGLCPIYRWHWPG